MTTLVEVEDLGPDAVEMQVLEAPAVQQLQRARDVALAARAFVADVEAHLGRRVERIPVTEADDADRTWGNQEKRRAPVWCWFRVRRTHGELDDEHEVAAVWPGDALK